MYYAKFTTQITCFGSTEQQIAKENSIELADNIWYCKLEQKFSMELTNNTVESVNKDTVE